MKMMIMVLKSTTAMLKKDLKTGPLKCYDLGDVIDWLENVTAFADFLYIMSLLIEVVQ